MSASLHTKNSVVPSLLPPAFGSVRGVLHHSEIVKINNENCRREQIREVIYFSSVTTVQPLCACEFYRKHLVYSLGWENILPLKFYRLDKNGTIFIVISCNTSVFVYSIKL